MDILEEKQRETDGGHSISTLTKCKLPFGAHGRKKRFFSPVLFFFLNRKVYGQLGPAFGRPCLFPCWSWLAEWSTKGGQRWSTGSF